MSLRKYIINKQFHHTLYVLYCLVLLLLTYGIVHKSGISYLDKILIYFISFSISYFIFYFLFNRKTFIDRITNIQLFKQNNLNFIADGLFYLTIVFIISHLIVIGKNPIVECWYNAYDTLDTARIRQEIGKDLSFFWKYGASFAVRCFIPFLLFYFYKTRNKIKFTLLFLVSSFYTISLIQKSFFMLILIPLILTLVFERKFIYAALLSLLIVSVMYFLVIVTNPQLRDAKPIEISNSEKKIKEKLKIEYDIINSVESSSSGLFNRIFIVPGKVVSEWFELIPSELPFLHGKGYAFLKFANNGEYIDYSREIFDFKNPQYKKINLKGTYNVASFMYDYSNFGTIGLIASSIIISFLLIFISILFDNNYKNLLIFNSLHVLLLSSSALSTLLFSGGWALTIVLFFIFKGKIEYNIIEKK